MAPAQRTVPDLVESLRKGTAKARSAAADRLATMLGEDPKLATTLLNYGAMQPLLDMACSDQILLLLTGWGVITAMADGGDKVCRRFVESGVLKLALALLNRQDWRGEAGTYRESRKRCEQRALETVLKVLRAVSHSKEATAAAAVGATDDAVYAALLPQLRRGCPPARVAAAELLCLAADHLSDAQADAALPHVAALLAEPAWAHKAAAARVVLAVVRSDAQRLRCVEAGAAHELLRMLPLKSYALDSAAAAALLNLAEHPSVPALVVDAGGLPAIHELMTMRCDTTTRVSALCILKAAALCRPVDANPYISDLDVCERILGDDCADHVRSFMGVFVEKRRATDYLEASPEQAGRFTGEELVMYKQLFKQMDLDASATLDLSELGLLLARQKIKVKKTALAKILAEVDTDGSGVLDFNEFLEIMGALKSGKKTGIALLIARASLAGVLGTALGPLFSQAVSLWTGLAVTEPDAIADAVAITEQEHRVEREEEEHADDDAAAAPAVTAPAGAAPTVLVADPGGTSKASPE